MRLFTRMLSCVAMALLLSAGLFHFAGWWLGDEENVVRLGRSLLKETRREQVFRERTGMVAESMEMKRDIISQVVVGRLHLREAIDQFQKANEVIENVDLSLVSAYLKPEYPEGVGRQVLAWTKCEVASWPADKANRLKQALEKEYRELFGTVEYLPTESWGREPNDPYGAVPARGTY